MLVVSAELGFLPASTSQSQLSCGHEPAKHNDWQDIEDLRLRELISMGNAENKKKGKRQKARFALIQNRYGSGRPSKGSEKPGRGSKNRAAAPAGLYCSDRDVGTLVRIYRYREDAWRKARIIKVDPSSLSHRVEYTVGISQWVSLGRCKFEILQRPKLTVKKMQVQAKNQRRRARHGGPGNSLGRVSKISIAWDSDVEGAENQGRPSGKAITEKMRALARIAAEELSSSHSYATAERTKPDFSTNSSTCGALPERTIPKVKHRLKRRPKKDGKVAREARPRSEPLKSPLSPKVSMLNSSKICIGKNKVVDYSNRKDIEKLSPSELKRAQKALFRHQRELLAARKKFYSPSAHS